MTFCIEDAIDVLLDPYAHPEVLDKLNHKAHTTIAVMDNSDVWEIKADVDS